MQSLYSLCLETIADHAEHITDWSSIPFDPFVLDIIQVLGEKESRIKASIYETIGAAHGHHLPNHLGSVSLMGRDVEALRRTTQELIPRFITHLDLSYMDDINDSSLLFLKPCIHLKVLEMTSTQITDRGVSHLARMADMNGLVRNNNSKSSFGLNQLQILGLSNNTISDMCLKHLVKIPSLTGVDLSYTSVTDVAIQFMKQHQFEILYAVSPPRMSITQSLLYPNNNRHSPPPSRTYFQNTNYRRNRYQQQQQQQNNNNNNDKMDSMALITWCGGTYYRNNSDQQRAGVEYLIGKKQKNPAYNIQLNPTLFKIVGEPLIPTMRQRRRSVYGTYFGDLCFVRPTSTVSVDEKKSKKLKMNSRGGARIEEPTRKRLRIIKEASPSPPPPLPTRKQSWPNAMDYLKMIEKDLGI
ncbi:hypothetical protein BDA99DRAFT_507765 [Phascolomyces articulosus]|uniref:Uncharacterized protein n=1 Tax=Phascolomyces articulosus TaxID=60185 RepID=A0AAD5PEW7_9FUNG|nr:hypothetical protein BDA99DRAFT_507765 [Phascolomyces articulosus]